MVILLGGFSLAGSNTSNTTKRYQMKKVNRRFHNGTVVAFAMLLGAAMTGCRTCPFGQEIVIPTADNTAPTVVMDFHLPNGNIVTVTPASTTTTIDVPGGGRVTVIVSARDSEGVKDAQIWAASKIWKTDPITHTESGGVAGTLGRPTASNEDTRSAGQNGCTERVVSQNLVVRNTPRGRTSYEVSAHAINFGNTDVSTPKVTLQAQ